MNRAQIVAIAAMSLDGRITRHDEPGTSFTSEADKRWLREVLEGFGGIILGSATYTAARDFIRPRLRRGLPRLVLTSRPEEFAADAVEGQLAFAAEGPSGALAHSVLAGADRIALMGGSVVYSRFLEAGFIDQWWITLEPYIFGSGRPLCTGVFRADYRLVGLEQWPGSTVLLKYARP